MQKTLQNRVVVYGKLLHNLILFCTSKSYGLVQLKYNLIIVFYKYYTIKILFGYLDIGYKNKCKESNTILVKKSFIIYGILR